MVLKAKSGVLGASKIKMGLSPRKGELDIIRKSPLQNRQMIQIDTTLKAGRNFYRQGSDKERINGLNELVYAVYNLKDSKKI